MFAMEENASQLHPALPTVDWAFVDDLRLLQMEGEPDFVAEMVALFLQETPILLDMIHQSIAESAPESLRRAAHTLKGNCNSIGAARMGALTLDLEKISRNETTQGASAIFVELKHEFENVSKAFMEGLK
jgi:HPt (histidine-containing phosphotransfer) domain-containing protein